MYQNCCKKCGSISLHTEVKGNNTGMYCDDCGAWVKWLGKDELRAFENSQKANGTNNISLSAENLRLNGKTMELRIPKNIAKITVCGAMCLTVTDMMNWIPPTEEQRKNLKEMFCIDVEFL